MCRPSGIDPSINRKLSDASFSTANLFELEYRVPKNFRAQGVLPGPGLFESRFENAYCAILTSLTLMTLSFILPSMVTLWPRCASILALEASSNL